MSKSIVETMCYNTGGFERDIAKGFYSLKNFPISDLETNLKEIINYIGSEYYRDCMVGNVAGGTLIALAYRFKNKTHILTQII